jgi:hypothetical protein
MDGPRATPPNSLPKPSPAMEAKPWVEGAHLPTAPREQSLLRPDADTIALLPPFDSRHVMHRLSVISAQLRCGEIVLPASVDPTSVSALVKQWSSDGHVTVGRSSQGEIVVRSDLGVGNQSGHFARMSSNFLVASAGKVTDLPIEHDWPEAWRDYQDCKGKRLLDLSCGGGSKVRALRELGVDAYGVDSCAVGAQTPYFLHYGHVERLPFVDGAFDRVEGRLAGWSLGEPGSPTSREVLAEVTRVTADGGLIRISQAREKDIHALVSERHDLALRESPLHVEGAFELLVRRQIS